MYPPELLRERPIGSATGSFIVTIPSEAPGDDSFPVKARAGDSNRTTVSTAVIAVEGPTGSPSGHRQSVGTETDCEPLPRIQPGTLRSRRRASRPAPRGSGR
jgi:hypothetical protein